MSYHLLLFLWLVGIALLSAIIVKTMSRMGVMDNPIERSSHTKPTPKGGGVGIMIAFILGSIIIFPLIHKNYSLPIIITLVTTALLSVLSWLDDLKQWPAILKLSGQIIIAILILLFIPSLSLLQQTNYILCPILLIWIIYITNAFNFMDGLNGLAAGVAVICCFFIAITSHLPVEFTLLYLAMMAGLIGFLPFNYPKAEIFMGDVGSQACGLFLAITAIIPLNTMDHLNFSNIPHTAILIFFLLFGMIYDVTLTLIRRTIEKQPLLQAHRSHLYQMAHRCSIPAYLITMIEWCFCAWGGLLIYFIPFTSTINIISAFSLLIIPQLIWTVFVYYKTKQHNIKKW